MKPELFSIGPITIHSFGLMIAIGVLAAFAVASRRAPKNRLDKDHVVSIGLCGMFGGILGAKLLYWITTAKAIIENPGLLLNISSGFVIYGGIIGGILAAFIYCKRKNIHFKSYLDLMIPSVALAQGCGRIGCFMAGCCYGEESSSRFNVIFPQNSMAPAGVPLLPVQLIASGLDFLLFAVLIMYARRKQPAGQVAALYLILYSAGRFVLEFFRGDTERGFIGIFSTSQFIAIILFLTGCILLTIQTVRKTSKKIRT